MAAIPKSAMVLAAGLGTRMRPLTDHIPKPMVKVAGIPLIDHLLDKLAAAGVEQAIVNVHYKADILEAHLLSRTLPHILISDERAQLLDTGGGVMNALHHIPDDYFYHLNADTIWIDGKGSNLSAMAALFDPEKMDTLLLLASTSGSVGYDGHGDFMMDNHGVLMRRTDDNIAPYVYAGVAILSRKLLINAPEGAFSLNRLFDRAIQKQRLYGMKLDGLWMHVGTPDAIQAAEKAIANYSA
jgi:N-acetyl-alpha-D-muramate 1-phosphate uridylyltransferase